MHGERTQAYGDAKLRIPTLANTHNDTLLVRKYDSKLNGPHAFQETSVTQQVVSAFYYQIAGRAHSLSGLFHALARTAMMLAFVSLRHISV